MDQIKLIEPCLDYSDDIWMFRQEIIDFDADNDDKFAGCLSLDSCGSAEEWINICELRKNIATCNQVGTPVPSNMYLAIRVSDNKIVGIIDLRHHIDHPILGTWGGHCGYSVRPSERGKGYAKEMLRLNLSNAKEFEIKDFLITCSDKNPASERAIIANGGVYDRSVEAGSTIIKRYWIKIK